MVVGKCVAGLACAVLPLWQRAQLPGATPAWVKKAGFQAVVLWQLLQFKVVGR
ncbi:MAG: hypothetical protein U0231_04480 [Nitrospiraceae bacterium]